MGFTPHSFIYNVLQKLYFVDEVQMLGGSVYYSEFKSYTEYTIPFLGMLRARIWFWVGILLGIYLYFAIEYIGNLFIVCYRIYMGVSLLPLYSRT